MTARPFTYSHGFGWLVAVLLVAAGCSDSGPTPPMGDIRFDSVLKTTVRLLKT
jgi:hypothetical protein